MNANKITTSAALAAGLLGSAALAQAAEYANVVSATPVMQSVAAPRQECAQGEQIVRQQPSGGGALIGAIVGGVLGNQFGHGVGRAAATGLGVVAGSAVGNNVEAANGGTATVPVRSCRTVGAYENRVVGYDVVYDYNGQRYTTRLPRDPGSRLAIDVRPAAAPLDRAGPPATYGAVPPASYGAVPPATYGAVPPATYGAVPSVQYDTPAYVDSPTYVQSAPTYYEQAPVYVERAPSYYAPWYYAPSYYYGPSAYVAPAVIGLGLGYWAGRSWYSGYRGGYRGDNGRPYRH